MKKITKNNKLIAKFMGFILNSYTDGSLCWSFDFNNPSSNVEAYRNYPNSTKYNPLNKLQFDTSWDWLMPVVEKIEQLGYFVIGFSTNTVIICEQKDVKKKYNTEILSLKTDA